jgi:hypothetical protein
MTFVWKYRKFEHSPLSKFDGTFHLVDDFLLRGYGTASMANYPDISRDEGPLKIRALHRLKRWDLITLCNSVLSQNNRILRCTTAKTSKEKCVRSAE